MWVRLDEGWPQNSKVLDLLGLGSRGYRAAAIYTFGLSYSGAQGLDGFVPTRALPMIHATKRDAALLVEVGLWHANGAAGWQIHDWADYQPSSDETRARSERAQRAARVRWSKQELRKGSE